MSALSSALQPIMEISSALGSVASFGSKLYGDSVDNKYLKKQNEQAYANAQASAALSKQQSQLQLLKDEADRKQALRKAVARQRASFGASGVGLDDDSGSSEAVLLGLYNDTALDDAYANQQKSLRDQALDLNAAQLQQKNLLEESRQREQQNVRYLTDSF